MKTSTARTILITIGTAMSYVGVFFEEDMFFYAVALGLTFWGCYLWTRLKNRHWAFMFWGLLTPAGLIGIWKLKDRSLISTSMNQENEEWEKH